jgi:hypothetical protein
MYVPSQPPQHASPRARELGNRIASLIKEFKHSYPDTSASDIYNGMRIAEANLKSELGGTLAARKLILVSLLISLLLALGVFLFVANQ